MSRYGIQVSQAGVPLSRAADYQKTLDDRWPIIECKFMGVLNLKGLQTAAAGTIDFVKLYRHGLGYQPGFKIKGISSAGYTVGSQRIEDRAVADDQYIYLKVNKSSGAVLTIDVKFFLMVIDRDLSKTYQAPIATPTALQASNPSTYGLKILQPNSPVKMDETNKISYDLNTNAKSMAIQMHGIQPVETSGVWANYLLLTHRLGYPPTYSVAKIFTQSGTGTALDGKQLTMPLAGGNGLASSDGVTLRIRGATNSISGNYIYIVLKDPVDTAK